MNRFIGAATALAVAFLIVTGRANAHALLDHAEPRVGSTVNSAPSEVSLWFSERLEPDFSKIQVTNEAGERVDQGDVHADAKNRSILRVSLKPLGSGTYTVKWRVVSVDTHPTEGEFVFHISP